jgi:hypothetical protein
LAPCYLSDLAASHKVPAVSIISSIIIQFLPSTVPTKFIVPIFPGASLYLIIIAKEEGLLFLVLSKSINFLALATPPASGLTTT